MLPDLPPEIWRLILMPQRASIADIDDAINQRQAKAAISDDDLMSPESLTPYFPSPVRKTILSRFWPGSPSYDCLRLVCKMFNRIISPLLFEEVRVEFNRKLMLDGLEIITTSEDMTLYTQSYNLSFAEERYLGQPQDLYITHLGMDDFDEKDKIEDEKEKQIMHRESLCVNLLTTNKIYDTHVEILSNLPRLTSLMLFTGERPLHKIGMDNSRNVQNQIGLLACRAFLQVCYQKSQLRLQIAPITCLCLTGLTDSCFYLPSSEVHQACLGMRYLQSFEMSFHKYDRLGGRGPLRIRKFPIAGRLLRAATKLRRMTLGWPWVDDNIYATHQPLLDFDSILLKRSTLLNVKPSLMLWSCLDVVLFAGISFKLQNLSAFLKAHKSTLRKLFFTACFIEYEHELEDSHDKPWQKLFMQSTAAKPHGKPWKEGRLTALSWGLTGHSHMSSREAGMWLEWLTGQSSDKPLEFDDSEEPIQCAVCRRVAVGILGPLSDSDLEDDEDYEDDEYHVEDDDSYVDTHTYGLGANMEHQHDEWDSTSTSTSETSEH